MTVDDWAWSSERHVDRIPVSQTSRTGEGEEGENKGSKPICGSIHPSVCQGAKTARLGQDRCRIEIGIASSVRSCAYGGWAKGHDDTQWAIRSPRRSPKNLDQRRQRHPRHPAGYDVPKVDKGCEDFFLSFFFFFHVDQQHVQSTVQGRREPFISGIGQGSRTLVPGEM